MRGKDLLDAVGYIDEELIKKAESPKKRISALLRYGSIAAVFALIVGTALLFPVFRHEKPPAPIDITDTRETTDTEYTESTDTTAPDNITTNITDTTIPNDTTTDIPGTTVPSDTTADIPGTDTQPTETTDAGTTSPPSTGLTPQAGDWKRFTVLGKTASYIKLSDTQISRVNYKNNSLLYIEDEQGIWMFWSIVSGENWTVDDILEIYGIASDNDIRELSNKTNNSTKPEEKIVTSRELITEFYDIIKNADIAHIYDPEFSRNFEFREEEHQISESKFTLYIDVTTQNGDVLSLILSPFANDLRWDDTYYLLDKGNGKRMFEILRGVTVEEYEEMLVKEAAEKPAQNAIRVESDKLYSTFERDPEDPNKILYPDDFGGSFLGEDGYLHVNITIPIEKASHYTDIVDPSVVHFYTVEFSYSQLMEIYDFIRPHMPEYKISSVGVATRYNKVQITTTSEEYKDNIVAFLSASSIPENSYEITVIGAIIPQ